MRRLLLTCAAAALACSVTWAQLPQGNPLLGLENLRDTQAMRSSSSDPNWREGNGDARGIAPGETLTIADLSGPGVITHIWFTIAHDAPGYSRLLTLRMYWDGEPNPSVECPIGDFFGIGHGVDKPFVSLPIRVSSDGRARNCYWPMPFNGSARITVTNDSTVPCAALFWYVDWQQRKVPVADIGYFHAMYRQESPCVMGRNYLIADVEGRGQWVGTMQSVYHMSDGWYGEGDDFFFVDGEAEPRLRGTGTEDYFCDAWGFREQDGPYYGTPLWEGYRAGDRSSAYRFHIPDPVPFTRSLRVEIEHKGSQSFADGTANGFIERDDLMSSVGLWYQTEPHKPWPALPPGAERLPFTERPVLVGHRQVETAAHSDAPLVAQELGGLVTDGKQFFFNPTDENAWAEIRFTLDEPVSGVLVGKFVHSWDYGKYRAVLDGQALETMDLQNDAVVARAHNWGMRDPAAGEHVLRLECVGKSSESKGYFLGFDALVVRTPVYSRPAGKDLRDLQAPKTP
jgi:hypothetical protein